MQLILNVEINFLKADSIRWQTRSQAPLSSGFNLLIYLLICFDVYENYVF